METAGGMISVVVPVFNSPDIDTLVEGIIEVLWDREFEIVLVDDASPDPSIWPTLERLAREDRRVRAFQLARNVGQQAATLCGLGEACGDLMITMDDDLQHDPADIATLLARSEHDVVIAQFRRRRHHFIRRSGSWIKGLLDNVIVAKPRGLTLSSFRLLNRAVVDGLLERQSSRPFLPALIFAVTRDVVGAPVEHNRRTSGHSGYTIRKLLRLLGDMALSSRYCVPGAVISVGMLLVIGGVGLGAYLTIFLGRYVSWHLLVAVVLIVGGAIMLGLGIVAQSLAHVMERGEYKPGSSFVRRRSPPPLEAADRIDDARLFRLRE